MIATTENGLLVREAIHDLPRLPKEWQWMCLRNLCKLVGDSIDPQQHPEEMFAHYSIPAFDEGHGPVIETGKSILSNKLLIPQGVVLFSKINPRISRVWYADESLAQRRLCSTEFLPLKPDTSLVDPYYLVYVLQDPSLIDSLRRRTAAATKSRERLRPEFVTDAMVPLPPCNEQKRIAAILGEQMAAVERARAAAEAQLAAARELPAAYLREVFDGDQACEWPRKTIGQIARVQSGYAFKSEWFSINGIRLLRNANIFQGFVGWDDLVHLPVERRPEFAAYELSEGDIVLSLDRPVVSNGLKVARLSSADIPALLLQRVGKFQLHGDVDAGYLYAFLNSPTFVSAITQHDQSLGVPHVSPKQVEAVVIPLPSVLEQRHFAAMVQEKLESVEQVRQSMQAQLDAINKLPATLLRQAFNGEL